MTLPLNPASRVYPNWPRDVLIIPEEYESRHLGNPRIPRGSPTTERSSTMTQLATPNQLAILTGMKFEGMTLDALLVHYNELAGAVGLDLRHAKFRDKPTGVKAIRGLLVQIAATANLKDAVDEAIESGAIAPTPKEAAMEEIRQDVVASQKAALTAARKEHDAADPVAPKDRAPKVDADTPSVKERGRKSKAPDDATILEVLVDNPKREEDRRARFDCYGGTKGDRIIVSNYIANVSKIGGDRRVALKDIVRDIRKGYIRIAS